MGGPPIERAVTLPRTLALAALLALAWTAAAAAELRIYRPRHRLPFELEELAAGIMGAGGSALTDPGSGQIVLKGPPDLLDQALAVLGGLDVPLASFAVESRVTSEAELERLGFRASAWVAMGDLRVGRSQPGSLQLEAAASRVAGRTVSGAEISVRDGSSADIWSGRIEPEAVTVLDERGRPTRVVVAAGRAVRTGLRVRPRALADGSLELEVQAIVAHDGLDSPVQESGARSRIRARPGEWLLLASSSGETTSRVVGLSQLGRSRERHDHVFLVRVRERSRSGEHEPYPASR